jgi:hypothetical protein
MPDYSKTIIYVIKCKDDNITEEYIGSTINFRSRERCHKSNCNNEKCKEYNCKKYQFIRDNGGWDNWFMIQLEEFPCENKRQAELKEEEVRVKRKTQLNMIRAYLSEEEKKEYKKKWKEENIENFKEQAKIWEENNKEKRKEQHKKWEEENKEKRKKCREKKNERERQKYAENKEKINEKQRQRRTKNKEKINERRRQKRAEKKLSQHIHNEPAEGNTDTS